jgi:hypothetical protein
VTLVGGGTAPGSADLLSAGDEEPPSDLRWPLVVAVLVVALVAVVGAVRPDRDEPRAGEVDAVLSLEADGISVSQTGVLVVPVQLRNLGAPLEVRRAQAYAEPVRLDPEVQAPPALEVQQTRRLIVLVAPDCRLLRVESGLSFRANILLRVGAGSVARDLVLDLGADPAVVQRVVGLCGSVGGPGAAGTSWPQLAS